MYGRSPRELRLAASLIGDWLYGFGNLRYGDVAAGDTSKRFPAPSSAFGQETSIERRERAAALAAVW